MYKRLLFLSTSLLISLGVRAQDEESQKTTTKNTIVSATATLSTRSLEEYLSSDKLIEETFSDLKHTTTCNILNSLYKGKSDIALMENLPLLLQLPESVKVENVLLKVYQRNGCWGPLDYDKFKEVLNTKFELSSYRKILSEMLKKYDQFTSKKFYDSFSRHRWSIDFLSKFFRNHLTKQESQQLGILSFLMGNEEEGITLLKEGWQGEKNTILDLQTAYILDYTQEEGTTTTHSHSYLSAIQLPAEEIINFTRSWINALYSLSREKFVSFQNFMRVQSVTNFPAVATLEDVFEYDLIKLEKAKFNYKSKSFDSFYFSSDNNWEMKEEIPISILQKGTFFTYPKESLKEFYKKYAKDARFSSPEKGGFALRFNRILDDSLKTRLDLLNYSNRYTECKAAQSDNTSAEFHRENNTYIRIFWHYITHENLQTSENTYYMAKAALFTAHRLLQYKKDVDTEVRIYLSAAKNFFQRVLEGDISTTTRTRAQYYMGLAHLYSREYEKAKEYLNESLFQGENLSKEKILQAQKLLAEIAFETGQYLESLNYFKQFETDKIINFKKVKSSDFTVKAEIMKCLCFHKLGFKEGLEQSLQTLKKFEWLGREFVFRLNERIENFEDIKPIYEVLKANRDEYTRTVIFDKYRTNLFLKGQYEEILWEARSSFYSNHLLLLKERRIALFLLFALVAQKTEEKAVYKHALKILTNFYEAIETKPSELLSVDEEIQIKKELLLHGKEFKCEGIPYYISNTALKEAEFTEVSMFPIVEIGINTYNEIKDPGFKHYGKIITRGLATPFQRIIGERAKKYLPPLFEEKLIKSAKIYRQTHSEKEYTNVLEYLQEKTSFTPSLHLLALITISYCKQNRVEEALDTLKRFTKIEGTQLKLNEGYSSDVYEHIHRELKENASAIMNTLLTKGDAVQVSAWKKYFSEKGIHFHFSARQKKTLKKGNTNLQHQIYKQEINKDLKEITPDYDSLKFATDKLLKTPSAEWKRLEIAYNQDLLKQVRALKERYEEGMKQFEKIAKQSTIDGEAFKKAKEVKQNCDQLKFKLQDYVNTMFSQMQLRNELRDKYQLTEADFSSPSTSSSQSAAREIRHYLKLKEIEAEQKRILIERRKQLRAEKRKEKQEAYATTQTPSKKEEETVKLSPQTKLISQGILPSAEQEYTMEDKLLLHTILRMKFNLNLESQETLRIILTGGERAFQINNGDIKKLFTKFEGFVQGTYHGGSHEKVAGLGLTLMPNADGNKKGSYHVQVKQALEKIIQILVPALTIEDLPDQNS